MSRWARTKWGLGLVPSVGALKKEAWRLHEPSAQSVIGTIPRVNHACVAVIFCSGRPLTRDGWLSAHWGTLNPPKAISGRQFLTIDNVHLSLLGPELHLFASLGRLRNVRVGSDSDHLGTEQILFLMGEERTSHDAHLTSGFSQVRVYHGTR